MVSSTARLGWQTTRDEELEQSRRALPKNLIHPLPYRIARASGSGDLLSRSPVHAGGRDGVGYRGGASRERWQNPRSISVYRGIGRAVLYIARLRKPRTGRTWAESTSRTYTRFGPVTDSPRSGSDPNWLNVTRPSIRFLSGKKIISARGSIPQPTARRVVTVTVPCRVERAEEEEERARLSLFSLSYQVMKHSTL